MYIAFLRAINVGGHNVKMEQLKTIFERLKLEHVQTFIASGNLLFDSDQTRETLQTQIETALKKTLGYEVIAFLRTRAEVAAIAAYKPFHDSSIQTARTFNVGFLKEALNPQSHQKLLALKTEFDEFQFVGQEIYWLSRQSQAESKLNNAVFEKKLGIRLTFRGISTIQKLAAKYPA
jgi:uncharacterized protein (DUF1697 family)